jgi:hypothetical protein
MAINGIGEKILFQRGNPSKSPNKKGAINPYLTKPEDLIRKDNEKGVLVIDPNKVFDDINNEIKDRYIKQEDLVMYASLKAYKRGNSSVVYSQSTGAKDKDITNDPIYINFLNPRGNIKNENGFYVNKGKMTSQWTDFFTSDSANDKSNSDFILDPESFGITNIAIKINASQHPIITIEFTDVQGRMLFERGNDKDNPYNIFYTYPYPKFALKYKGYYGKAVEMQMVLIKSNTRFDPSTGNYNITAEFQSDVFSIFNTFLVIYAYVAPYMFKLDNGEYLGGKILKELYEKQNSKIKAEVGNDEFPKYEILRAPTLFDLAGALKNIPIDVTNQSNNTNESVSANENLINSKVTIESYGLFIRDYFTNNPESYGVVIDNNLDLYVPTSPESYIDGVNKTPTDLFSNIERINDAIKSIASISLRGQGDSFLSRVKEKIKQNRVLNTYFSNIDSLTAENIIQPNIFLVKNPPNDIVKPITLDPFINVLEIIFDSISEVQTVIEDQNISDQISDLGASLGYQPTLSNILRIISNNMQTFIIMLDIMGKSAINQLKVDLLRIRTQNKYSETPKEFDKTIYSSFPNYFKKITEVNGGSEINKMVLSYPGADKLNNNWFEVRFVEEIYEAINRIKIVANPPVNGFTQQNPTSLLSVFQLGDENLDVYTNKEHTRVLSEAFSRYSLYISYSGLLYRGITNFSSNVSAVIADFETDLIFKNVFSKIQSKESKFVITNEINASTKSGVLEDGVSYSNLANFGIKFIGFDDKTLSGSLNTLRPVFSELSQFTTGSYTKEKYDNSLKKLNTLLNNVKNKNAYDIIRYINSDNNVNQYSNSRDKKINPTTHFIDLRPNYNYYCDNGDILKTMSKNIENVDGDKLNKNNYQGLYINLNNTLKTIITPTDISRTVSQNFNDDIPALTFNTKNDDYQQMVGNIPFNKVQRVSDENFHDTFNLI